MWFRFACTAPALVVTALWLGCGTVREGGSGDNVDGGGPPRIFCSTDLDCPLIEPICDTDLGFCRLCTASSECSAKPGLPLCATDIGRCVACLGDEQCTTAASVCDPEDYVCRGCESNGECDSGLCDLTTHQCAADDRIIWVLAGSGEVSPTCGAAGTPCTSIDQGFDRSATAPYNDGGPVYLVIQAATYQVGVGLEAIPAGLYIDASGATLELDQASPPNTAFQVGGAVTWRGGTFDGNGDADTGSFVDVRAFSMSGGSLRLIGVTFENMHTAILETTGGGKLVVEESVFDGNLDSINTAGTLTALRVERSRFVRNRGVTIAATAPAIIRSNLFARNGRVEAPGQVIRLTASGNLGESAVLSFNTFAANFRADDLGIVQCIGVGQPVVLASNIIWDVLPAESDFEVVECAPENVTGNILQVAPGSPFLIDENNSNAAPLFTDGQNGDFSLRDTSPAVDAGDPLWAPPFDIDGVSRNLGESPDIGAFERTP